MMQTTLRKIRAAGPCGMRLEDGQRVGYLKLRHRMAYLVKEHALIAAQYIFGLKGGEL